MNLLPLFLLALIHLSYCVKTKSKNNTTSSEEIKKKILQHEEALSKKVTTNKSEVKPVKITNVVIPKLHPVTATTPKPAPEMISPETIQKWAIELRNSFFKIDEGVVQRHQLVESFKYIKSVQRNGTAIVNKMAEDVESLLSKRTRAAEEIMRRAEDLAKYKTKPSPDYTFDRSIDLDVVKKQIDLKELTTMQVESHTGPFCRSLRKLQLSHRKHFDANVSLDATSVQVTEDVFDCKPKVVEHMFWSEGLLSTFQKNYAQDSSIEFQYFCSSQGFLRHYPAALWSDMFKLKLGDISDVYDCRLRPWYVSAGGAPRDVLILLDASGSMTNSSNQLTGEQFTLALLSALTDDDRVNVLRYNVEIQSPISCFNDKLVPANHVNSAAMMQAMKMYNMTNETYMTDVLTYAVKLLQDQHKAKDRPTACQQAIVLVTDSLYENFTDLLHKLNPEGNIRLFILWLHDRFGLRDNTRLYADWLSCDRDGYFAELITQSDVTEQVFKILQTMERPLVSQRKDRPIMFSDVYAHVEDPRRSEFYWQSKENTEQSNRYKELIHHKDQIHNADRLLKDFTRSKDLNISGQYYEGQDLNYRLLISISVPVFEHTTSENITITLDEEKMRNSTRTYPVNRLLGVAGVDIPIDHLKWRLPYHQVGAGGSLFLIDHRGNIVVHDNLKPTFDGDILRPGYRTVDFIDLEQAAESHTPRYYPEEWVKLRKKIIIDKESGNHSMFAKNIFEDGMRAILEMREYHWKRILNHYTAVVAIPSYNRYHKVPEGTFTKDIAQAAMRSLTQTEFLIQPDWLYCRHIEPHFDSREVEIVHFIRRRSDEPNFAMQKLNHLFSSIKPALLEKNYMCNEELMGRFCREVIATDKWAKDQEKPSHDCTTCELGSITAFFATENGLTRWKQYHATSSHAPPPNASWWSHGPTEPWYKRAAAAPHKLMIHAPVSPMRRRRITLENPPPFDIHSEWYTAAQVVGTPKEGIVGVAGFHFHPHHLKNLFSTVTNSPIDEDDITRCDGKVWSCVLIDEYGWILSHEGNNHTEPPVDPLRKHFATLHPTAMAALLREGVFEMNWVHDYQGVCFTPKDEGMSSAMTIVPSILKSLWHAASLVFWMTKEIVFLISTLSTGTLVSGDTEIEKQKRRRRLWRDYEREKYDFLYNDTVLVNRTKFAACDRSRVIYLLQDTPKAKAALKRPAMACTWPLVAAPVPDTNLLLIAVFNDCPNFVTRVKDPLINEMYVEDEEEVTSTSMQSSASKLACWRNRQQLPTRPPHIQCYPHEYRKENGYRQCGPWLPDPEPEDGASYIKVSNILLIFTVTTYLIKYLLFM